MEGAGRKGRGGNEPKGRQREGGREGWEDLLGMRDGGGGRAGRIEGGGKEGGRKVGRVLIITCLTRLHDSAGNASAMFLIRES